MLYAPQTNTDNDANGNYEEQNLADPSSGAIPVSGSLRVCVLTCTCVCVFMVARKCCERFVHVYGCSTQKRRQEAGDRIYQVRSEFI